MRADYQLLKNREAKVTAKLAELEAREQVFKEREARLKLRQDLALKQDLSLCKLQKNLSDDVKLKDKLD